MTAIAENSTTDIPRTALEARAEALGNMRGEDVNDDRTWAALLSDAQAEWDDKPLRCATYPDLCGCPQI